MILTTAGSIIMLNRVNFALTERCGMSRIAVIIKAGRLQKNYWVFGNRKTGFGVKILWHGAGKIEAFSQTPLVFAHREQALALMRQLIHSDVHPVHLLDIVRDYMLEQYWDLCPVFSD